MARLPGSDEFAKPAKFGQPGGPREFAIITRGSKQVGGKSQVRIPAPVVVKTPPPVVQAP